MAYDYNKAKQAWEMMDDNQKKQYTEQNKNDANFQQFAQQYHNENYGSGNSSSNGSVNQNNTVNNTQGTNTQPTTQSNQNQTNQNGTTYDFSNNHSTLSDGKNGDGKFYGNTQFDKEEQFDKSMIGDTQGIKIQEGTGKDTGRPDYQIDTDARLNEMRNNLNQYFQTNPEWFQDRETFNKQFEYNQRESDAQRALLDSYWKKAQDMRTVNNYTNGDSVMAGFNNYDITPDQMSLLRQYNPEAYAQWQKQMQDELNARITNMAAPRDVWDTVDLWGEIVKKLGIEAGDPYDIYGTWYGMAEQLGVFRDSQQLESMSNNIASIYSTMNSNVQNISSQLEGRYSAGYIEARINKANSRLNSQASSMQYSYNLLLQKRNQNMAIAQQAGAMKQAQGQEDTRVFNDKLRALNFAMTADSYRTPEQQQQLQLQTEQIRNDMSLLNQSKLNDLSLYNQYATAKMQNQLNYEMQDLTVSDPKQLRANLSNVLDQWYSQYGDIIERPKSQVIEDVIAYAKENGISVAEALKKNFIEPLQSKPEYQKSVIDAYGMNAKNEYIKIGDSGAILTTNPDGSFSVSYLGGGSAGVGSAGSVGSNGVYNFSEGEVRTGDTIGNDINSIGHILQSDDGLRVGTYTSKNGYTYNVYPDRETGIQATVNLLKKGYYGKTLADAAQKWIGQGKDISTAKSVITKLGLSLDEKLGDNNVRKFIEAMGTWEGTLKGGQSLEEWAKGGKDLSGYKTTEEVSGVTSDPYSGVSGYTKNGTEINAGGWITSLESTYAQDKWRSDGDRDAVLNGYGITIKDFNEQRKKYAEHMMATELQSTLQDSLDRINALIEWEDKENSGIGDYHQGWLDRMSVDTEGEKSWVDNLINPFGTYTDATKGKSLFDYLKNNETLNKFLNLKQNGATFGAMQQAEWDMIASSVSELKWEQPKDVFQDNLKKVKERLEKQMMELDPTYAADGGIPKDYLEKHGIKFEYQPGVGDVNMDLTGMIDYVAG